MLLPLLHQDWSHTRGLWDILSSLQAALASRPFTTAQGWDPTVHRAVLQHCTLQTAVLEGFETGSISLCSPVRQAAREVFFNSYSYYRQVCSSNMDRDGEEMIDHMGENRGNFRFEKLLDRLESLKENLEVEQRSAGAFLEPGEQPHFQPVVAGTSKEFTVLSSTDFQLALGAGAESGSVQG